MRSPSGSSARSVASALTGSSSSAAVSSTGSYASTSSTTTAIDRIEASASSRRGLDHFRSVRLPSSPAESAAGTDSEA